MTKRYAALLVSGILAVAGCTFGQQDASQSMPNIPAPKKPAPEEQTGVLGGNKPFSLTTDPDGEFVYKFNEDNELETLEAKKGVVFRVSLFRFALFLFTLLFFVSAFASTPARIKRLTLKCTEIVSLDCSQELALHQTGGIGLSTARTAIRTAISGKKRKEKV